MGERSLMPNSATYDASALDRGALNELAKRAAQQTTLKPDPRIVYFDRTTNANVDVLGEHWVLSHRRERYENQPNDAVIEEGSADAVYALLPAGDLVLVEIFEEDRIRTTGVQLSNTNRHSLQPMSDSDVESFDFARKHYEHGYQTDHHLWGDLNRDFDRGDLLHDTKGAGLAALLDSVRTGNADLPMGPSQFHTPKTPPPKPPAQARQTARPAQSSGSPGLTRLQKRLRSVAKGAGVCAVLGLILSFVAFDGFSPPLFFGAVTAGAVVGWFASS
jgi:hypothetical protein